MTVLGTCDEMNSEFTATLEETWDGSGGSEVGGFGSKVLHF